MKGIPIFLEIPTILVGMGRIRHALTRFPQIASRIGVYVEFTAADIADVRRLVEKLCEVPVAPDLVELLAKQSEGLVREIKEGVANIERYGFRNKGMTIGVKEMSGQVLLNDRRSGQPILVKA